jgi:hypothetical protein
LGDLVSSGEERTSVAGLLDVLASARLIVKTANEEKIKVEVAHEALISHWQRLQLWLNEDREGLYLHQHLSYSAHEWEDHGREAGDLYRGMRLQQAQQWRKDHLSLLSSLESDFLTASLHEHHRERRATLLRWSAFAGATLFLLLTIRLALTGQINRFYYRPVDMQGYWMVIPAGEFQMGSERGAEDEQPVHSVYLDAFEMGRHEVTNRQFAQCVRAGVCAEEDIQPEGRDQYPVVNVGWEDAAKFCSWVEGRLPTEAEWEKAARGGLIGRQDVSVGRGNACVYKGCKKRRQFWRHL